MSNVLEFLERVGQDWQLRYADPVTLTHAMQQAGIEESLHPALLTRDARGLEALLNLTGNVCCAVHPAHEDDADDDEEDDLDDEDDDEDVDLDEEDDLS
jgi:hypothetical protein